MLQTSFPVSLTNIRYVTAHYGILFTPNSSYDVLRCFFGGLSLLPRCGRDQDWMSPRTV